MDNLLRIYIERALREPEAPVGTGSGPVVTISREFGCPSKVIGQLLTETLNKKAEKSSPETYWRFINKEIVDSAAREMNLQTNELNYFMNTGGRGLLEDILVSFTSGYISNIRIRNTISNIVKAMAQNGHFVMIGRGSVGVLYGQPNSLHIRLQAPLDWRIPEICKLRQTNEAEALKMAQEMDKKRTALIELMSGHKYNPYLFDLQINCSTLNQVEIVQTIIGAMQSKKMI